MISDIRISDEKAKLDREMIFRFLNQEARWCKGIPRSRVETAINNSLCLGSYYQDKQIGFARVVTDYATFANVVDVFVLSEYRGRGVSRLMMDALIAHPQLQGLRRWMLATSDKQGLYAKFGFTALPRPEIFMERFDPDVYRQRS